MKPVTIWKKYDEKLKQFVHNHIEDGHALTDSPTPVTEYQKKVWANSKWQKEYGFLQESRVVSQ